MLPDTFFVVPRASGTVSKFCAPGLIFDGTEGVRTRFHVLRSRTLFGRNRGRQVPFSCFALPDSFRGYRGRPVPFSSFCAPELVFDGIEGVGASFHVLRYQTLFGRYRGHRDSFSNFVLPDLFSTVPRASGLVFMFWAPRHIFAVPRASTHF
jgi:hypothetical protein